MPDTQVKHPSKFSNVLLAEIQRHVPEGARVLDPFAGTGRIHELENCETVGIEIEPEWASMHPQTLLGDALALPFADESFDVIATSPVYGNRMSDHHNAKDASRRIGYRFALGRPLNENNSGKLQWGKKYREFHVKAWAESLRVLKPGGVFILNISDHVRAGEAQPVTEWHRDTLIGMGLQMQTQVPVLTPRMRFGRNSDRRSQYEYVLVFKKGA